MNERYYKPKKAVLLTGAGFSKPFGGFLASEMWSIFFNRLTSPGYSRMRHILRGNLNYELAYAQVIAGEYAQNEKDYFTKCLMEAYADLDRSLCEITYDKRAFIQPLRTFIDLFAGEGNERGFVFTLNQDLLIERFYSNHNFLLQIPSLHHTDWFRGTMDRADLPQVDIPPNQQLDRDKGEFWAKGKSTQNFCYLKLHGSFGWRSLINKNAMVIGSDKAGSIANEPLLKWYLDLFREVLNSKDQTLVVVGYGFRDDHINSIIADAGKQGLRLHVISPLQVSEFKNILISTGSIVTKATHRGNEIWEMLEGYYCESVVQLFPESNKHATAIGRTFLQNVGLQ